MSTLLHQVNACVRHEKCRVRFSGAPLPELGQGFLPTRCLDIGGSHVVLRSTKSLTGKYLTLSHRWNEDTERTKTTMANLEARENGVWDCDLPKLYTDVFALAKQLEVRYVWIDSLCIIQVGDQGQDWNREAPKMGSYYTESLLTVMSTAPAKEDGLYPPRSHSLSQFARIPYRTAAGGIDGHFFIHRLHLTIEELFETSVQTSELASRGWVFQEQQLSRRAVYFTSHGMLFRCCTLCSTDSDELSLGEEEEPSKEATVQDWYSDYLSRYTGLQLTQPDKDRLVAVSGVMNEYAWKLQRRHPGDAFYDAQDLVDLPGTNDIEMWMRCGHWWFDLRTSLLWQLDSPATEDLQQLAKYPSWSWASILAQVSWEGMFPEYCLALIHFERLDETGGDDASLHNEVRVHIPPDPPSDEIVQIAVEQDQDRPNIRPTMSLLAHGRLLAVSITRLLKDLQEARIVARLSNSLKAANFTNDDSFTRATNWRAVCLPSSPNEVAGWASIEHPDFQRDTALLSGPLIYALTIFKTPNYEYPHAHGKFYSDTPTYTVLYVRSVAGEARYERVGVGRLFGDSAKEAYGRASEESLFLV